MREERRFNVPRSEASLARFLFTYDAGVSLRVHRLPSLHIDRDLTPGLVIGRSAGDGDVKGDLSHEAHLCHLPHNAFARLEIGLQVLARGFVRDLDPHSRRSVGCRRKGQIPGVATGLTRTAPAYARRGTARPGSKSAGRPAKTSQGAGPSPESCGSSPRPRERNAHCRASSNSPVSRRNPYLPPSPRAAERRP